MPSLNLAGAAIPRFERQHYTVVQHRALKRTQKNVSKRSTVSAHGLTVEFKWQYVLMVSRVPSRSLDGTGCRAWGRCRTVGRYLSTLFVSCATTTSSPALYITVHPQQPPFFSVSSSTPILATPFWFCAPDGAPVYEDISLLYLRISRTIS